MIDFKLTDDLDIAVENGEICSSDNGETTLTCAFFTDARYNSARGYWLDLLSSELWIYDQARITSDTINNLAQSARDVAAALVDDGIFLKVDTFVTIEDGIVTLSVKCHGEGNALVVDRKFSV